MEENIPLIQDNYESSQVEANVLVRMLLVFVFSHLSMLIQDPDVGVWPNVPEDRVHAQQGGAGADAGIVVVGHGVEERDALALLQDLVVGGGKQAVGQAVSVNQVEALLQNMFFFICLFLETFYEGSFVMEKLDQGLKERISLQGKFAHLIVGNKRAVCMEIKQTTYIKRRKCTFMHGLDS